MSEIAKYYAGKSVLISGASGFMGKVLLERMLCTLNDIGRIYLLLRPKKGLNPEERVSYLLSQPPFTFNNISQRQLDKVFAIPADLNKDNIGLTEEDQDKIINEVSVVIHMAASVRFDLSLKDAIIQNTIATKHIMELCTQIKKLSSVIYVSTTFCNIDVSHCEEKVYDIQGVDVYKIIDLVIRDDDKQLSQIENRIMKPHPNTYTFSKRLAEIVVRDMGAKLPLSIARPSIVCPAWQKPIKGWVDNFNGPIGMFTAVSTGIIRVIWGDVYVKLDGVPVDCAINGIIASSWYRASKKVTRAMVFNFTLMEEKKVTWKYVTDISRKVAQKQPQKMMLWYPRGFGTTNIFIYMFYTIFCHFIPALILDGLLFIFRQKPFLVRLQKRIYSGNKLVSFFATREFFFAVENTKKLFGALTSEDQKIFYDMNSIVVDEEYFKKSYLCTQKYLLHDDGKSTFRYTLINILFVLDALLQTCTIYGLLWVILYFFGTSHILTLSYWYNNR